MPPTCRPSQVGRTMGGAAGAQGACGVQGPPGSPSLPPLPPPLSVVPRPAGIQAETGSRRPSTGFSFRVSSEKLLSRRLRKANPKSPISQIRGKQSPSNNVTQGRGSALALLGIGHAPLRAWGAVPESRGSGATPRSYVEGLPSGGQHPPCIRRRGTFVPIQGTQPRELVLGDRNRAQ